MNSTLRIGLALAAKYDYCMEQLDVATAFLNAPVEEEVYITLPAGTGGEGVVYRLRKALYGLRQAPRAWYEALRVEMEKLGFESSKADPGLFFRRREPGGPVEVFICCHVDDMALFGKHLKELQEVKAMLGRVFKITDMGAIKRYVGMEINRDPSSGVIRLTQSQYTQEMLEKYKMDEVRPRNTPLDPGAKFSAAVGVPLEPEGVGQYRSWVGSLMYLSTNTRPDITYAVGVLARYMYAAADGCALGGGQQRDALHQHHSVHGDRVRRWRRRRDRRIQRCGLRRRPGQAAVHDGATAHDERRCRHVGQQVADDGGHFYG
jgi:histone deacetylase 1/2